MTTNGEVREPVKGVAVVNAEAQTHAAVAPHIIAAPSVTDPKTGAIWMFGGYELAKQPWADEKHIGPIATAESFGDVASWAAYVQRFGLADYVLLTWNSSGLRAVLDYHSHADAPGRCQWTAEHKFTLARQLQRWMEFADGDGRDQRRLIEFLEDMADTVVQPVAVELTGILSTLRASVGSNAASTLNPDGSYSVEFRKEAKLTGSGTIPPTFVIRVPVLVGHTNEDGSPVVYDLTVRLRVTPTEQGAVFRLSIPNLLTTLEDAYTDRVQAARAALGESYEILRAADSK